MVCLKEAAAWGIINIRKSAAARPTGNESFSISDAAKPKLVNGPKYQVQRSLELGRKSRVRLAPCYVRQYWKESYKAMQHWFHKRSSLTWLIGSAFAVACCFAFLQNRPSPGSAVNSAWASPVTGAAGGPSTKAGAKHGAKNPMLAGPKVAKKPARMPGRPAGAAGLAKPGAVATASVHLPFTPRKDPFASYVPYSVLLKRYLDSLNARIPVTSLAPPVIIARYTPQHSIIPSSTAPGVAARTAAQEAYYGRVSGVMVSNGAYAIVENNGESAVVQPGDYLPGEDVRVVSIQSDGITVRTTDNQTIHIGVSEGGSQTPGMNSGASGVGSPPDLGDNSGDNGDTGDNGA